MGHRHRHAVDVNAMLGEAHGTRGERLCELQLSVRRPTPWWVRKAGDTAFERGAYAKNCSAQTVFNGKNVTHAEGI